MNVPAIQSDWVGRVIDGRFSLLQWLGGSVRSGVFLTELPGELSQKAAIKLLPADAGVETRIAFAVNASRAHANLVCVLQSGSCEIDGASFVFVVTEFADEVLSEILPMRALAPEEVKEMLVPVLDALTDLHGHGLEHGRLKPSNILVVNEELKLSADSVQLAGSSADETPAISVYDAPERAEGTLTPASDIWSLGVTMVEALTQHTPDWNRSTHRDVQISDGIPQPFAAIVDACLRVDAARRPTLNDIRSRLGLAAPVASASPPPPKPAANVEPRSIAQALPRLATEDEPELRKKPRLGVLLVMALILVAVVALLWSRSHGTVPATKSNDEPPVQSSVPEPEQQPPPAANAPSAGNTTAPGQSSVGALRGAVAQRVMPDVLPAASQSIHGTVNVSVRVNVSPAGEVTDAGFESAGPSKYFARVAMEAARQWKFTPARANGQPIASVWTLHFAFTRENTDVTPVQTVP
jgi:TonB family protein